MANKYYDAIKRFKCKVEEYVHSILEEYDYEIRLLFNDCNLLARKDNAIETSTAIGYLFEEFIVSKLIFHTKNNSTTSNEFKILANTASTTSLSYDCHSIINYGKKNIFAMINIKTEKGASSNAAIAAITQLHEDYCLENPDQYKCFMVLKLKYSFEKEGDNRVISVNGVESYFLEELDFSKGHIQDHRSWSGMTNYNSGRLRINRRFYDEHKLPESEISYHRLFMDLDSLFENNRD